MSDATRCQMSDVGRRVAAKLPLTSDILHLASSFGGIMYTLWQDMRYGARMLLKQRGFTLIALLTISLGVGANTAIFSVINAVLLRPLPYPESDRLALYNERSPQMDGMSISWPNYTDWRAQQRVFEE